MVNMEETEKTPIRKKKARIDWYLVPLKLHYVLFWGGAAAAVLFMPLLAKQIGIHASAVGIIYTAISLASLLSQPGFGAVSDHFQNSKAVLMVLVAVAGITLFALLYIPPIRSENTLHDIVLSCTNNDFRVYPSTDYNSSCLNYILTKGGICNTSGTAILPSLLCSDRIAKANNIDEKTGFINYTNPANCSTFHIEGCNEQDFNLITCDSSLDSCFFKNDPVETNVYRTYQFWIFALLAIVSISLVNTCYSLSDSMCYDILGDNPKLFGQQRLWSTCSYGITSFLAGYLNDATAEKSSPAHYDMGYYVMIAMFSLDLIVLSRMRPTKVTISKFSFKDVGHVMVSFNVIIFTVGVFFIGILTAILYNYQFWFLQDLGASQTLLGLTMLAQNVVADLLFFLIAGRIIESVGHFYCLIISFIAFAVRYLLYFLLPGPWYMLPVEILDGVTFSLFYVTMTSFAKRNAQPGTEATMVGVLVGLYSGLGAAVGSLLGGMSFESLTGPYTFLVSGVAGIVFALVFFIFKLTRHKSSYTVQSS